MSATVSNTAELLNQLRRSPVGERLDRLRAHGPPEDLLLPLIDEASGLTMVDADEAIEATNLVVWLADRLADPLAQARARRARARAMSYAGRFDESLIACDEALEAARRGGHLDEAGRARLASMHALIDLGRLDDAIAASESARNVSPRPCGRSRTPAPPSPRRSPKATSPTSRRGRGGWPRPCGSSSGPGGAWK